VVIYNSATKQKETFTPLEEKRVKIYVCGPTVYDDAHLGHARSSIAFDLLRRTLIALGYKVTFVKNYTDIDDKILKKMSESGKSLEEITLYYIKRYEDDMNALNILEPDIKPKATESIDSIIEFVNSLLKKGIAYKIDDGIYFDTTKDSNYLSISHMHIDDAKARVDENYQKRDNKDFALWKFAKKDEISYPAPFGDGRPGWHIECSCMIKKHLSYKNKTHQIDIHGGGADLLFPHHENEAAQSRCESGIELAKYWMHNGFVQINNQKMSKSLGNSFFLKDALKRYDGEILRFYLISTHYRSNFNFNEEDLLSSKKRLDKLYRLKKKIAVQSGSSVNKEFKRILLDALSDDLNISKALSIVDEMVQDANQKLDTNPKDKATKKEVFSNIEFINKVLGIGEKNPTEYFQIGIDKKTKKKIEELIKKRSEAKKKKNFAKADSIRDELLSMGITIQDTPNGTLWERDE
jgi:cysteinyl-tRNA synthetase